jgi:hypothetical protein
MPAHRKFELTEGQCGHIVGLRDACYTYREIGDMMGISYSCARKTVLRFQKHNTYSSLPRSGRPPVISDRMRRLIIRYLRRYRFEDYRTIAGHIDGVTERHVRLVAQQEDYHRCVAHAKPYIKPEHATKRLKWAAENEQRDWDSVMWTDETILETGKQIGWQRVTRKPHE